MTHADIIYYCNFMHAENDMKMSQSPNNKGTATFIELKFYFHFNLVIKAHKSRSCQMNGTDV